MSITPLHLLISLGIAITVQAQDCSRPVSGPNMDLKDNDINLQSFPDGIKVTFACNIGYRPTGSASITCTAGSWSVLRLTCEKKNCGSAGEVTNGQIDYPDGTEFGAQAVVTCKTGYIRVGRGDVTCGDGGWIGRLPVCEVVTCDPPPAVPSITFIPSKEHYQYRDVIQYSCEQGLILVGSKSRTCSEDKTFQPDPPTCTMVKCETPYSAESNIEWVGGARPPYGHKSTVRLGCKTGYTPSAPVSVTCEINSKWSPELPECKLITPSTTPKSTTTTTTSPTSTKAPSNDGNNLPLILGLVFGVLIFIAVGCGCYCFGVPAFIKKKRGKHSSPVSPTLVDVKPTP
ncbi:unnamed protein product [Ophioblennius macclurei]